MERNFHSRGVRTPAPSYVQGFEGKSRTGRHAGPWEAGECWAAHRSSWQDRAGRAPQIRSLSWHSSTRIWSRHRGRGGRRNLCRGLHSTCCAHGCPRTHGRPRPPSAPPGSDSGRSPQCWCSARSCKCQESGTRQCLQGPWGHRDVSRPHHWPFPSPHRSPRVQPPDSPTQYRPPGASRKPDLQRHVKLPSSLRHTPLVHMVVVAHSLRSGDIGRGWVPAGQVRCPPLTGPALHVD